MTSAWERRIDGWPAVTLDEVDAEAALQTRVDRKYVVTAQQWDDATALIGSARVLTIAGKRRFRYESVYYDTPRLDSYRDAARRRPSRVKVRARHYLDAGTVAIEVKQRQRTGETVKTRHWMSPDAAPALTPRALPPEALEFVQSFDGLADAAPHLREVLTTSYERITLVTDDARVTVDRHTRGVTPDGRSVGFGGAVIVETKSPAKAGLVDRTLWSLGARPARVSKYCTALAALNPDLPSNRWHRTLQRHLATAA